MSATGSTCAMCGDRLGEPYSGFDLPPVCVQLLDGGDDVDADDLGGGGVDQRAITDAAATVKAHRDGDAEHLMPSKVDAAYITLWSLRELGIVD